MEKLVVSQILLVAYKRFRQTIIDINRCVNSLALDKFFSPSANNFNNNFDRCFIKIKQKRIIFTVRDAIKNCLLKMKKKYSKLLYYRYIRFFSVNKCKQMFNIDNRTYFRWHTSALKEFYNEFCKLGFGKSWFDDNCLGISCFDGAHLRIQESLAEDGALGGDDYVLLDC